MDDDFLLPHPSVLLRKKPFFDLLEPSPMAPISAFTRDPWWYPSYAPYIPSYAQYRTPFYLRDSYLSPIKRSYLWSRHPIRPFGMCAFSSFNEQHVVCSRDVLSTNATPWVLLYNNDSTSPRFRPFSKSVTDESFV